MTACEKMKAALGAIRLYDTDAPNLNAELRAYGDELDRMEAELDELLPERFLQTAGDRGLSAYEEMFGPARRELTNEERRRLLLLRVTLGGGDFTPAGIRQALDSFGLDYVIAEFPAHDRLNIIAQTEYTKAQQKLIRQETQKIIPAHLEYQLVFNTLTWAQLDARGLTFAALDQENLTWEQIDALEQ